MIERVTFDESANRLCIWFRGTGKYVYDDVPIAIFEAFCEAPSAGTFFNAHIRENFPYRRDPERRYFRPTV